MITHKINRLAILFFITVGACSPDLADDPIPFASFPDIVLTLPNYPALLTNGGYIYRSEGVRGIIIYRKDAITFLTFERNCSFQPNDACATVDVHSSSLFMIDSCCGSTFNFEGKPTGDPAWRPLRQYQTSLLGNTLTITDTPVND